MRLLTHFLQTARPEIRNWRENYVNDSLFYSYRDTAYDRSTYPSALHYHDYFEVVIFLEGDIRYLCESAVYEPREGDIIVIPPGKLHMSALNCEATRYRRHVFYLYPDAFDGMGCHELSRVLHRSSDGFSLSLSEPEGKRELLSLLSRLDQALASDLPLEKALAVSLILQIFYWMNRDRASSPTRQRPLPEPVAQIKAYLDQNVAEIDSVSGVAERFFYSREYVSRLFKKHFNTTISDYIRKRRIAMSCELIAEGMPLIDICYRVGFGNLSTFIRVFREITGITPSQYRRMLP